MPAEFVASTVATPVCTLVMVTVTPETNAPEGSETVPLISPVFAFCAQIRLVVKVRNNATTRRTRLPACINLIAETSGANFEKEPAPQFVQDADGSVPLRI